MLKVLFSLVKRFILAAFVLYGYNLIAVAFNLIIPINLITITLVATLGTPALFGMILLLIIAY